MRPTDNKPVGAIHRTLRNVLRTLPQPKPMFSTMTPNPTDQSPDLAPLIAALTPTERKSLLEHDLGSGLGRLVAAVKADAPVAVTAWTLTRDYALSPGFLALRRAPGTRSTRVMLSLDPKFNQKVRYLSRPELLELARACTIAAGELGGVVLAEPGKTYGKMRSYDDHGLVLDVAQTLGSMIERPDT